MSQPKLTYHEIANLFPMMSDEGFKSLKSDIELNGQRIPIAVYKDQILDGRNRHKACEELGISPLIKILDDKTDPLDYVVSVNLKRRTLTQSQRAFIALDLLPFYEKQAKDRQKAHGGTAPGKKSLTPGMEEVSTGEATKQAGKAVGVSRSYVAEAKKIAKSSPEMEKQVRAGELSIAQAELKIKKDENYEKELERAANISVPVMPPTNFDLILADPPWGKEPNQLRTDELCHINLPANADCVLFFWTAGLKIPEALRLLRCWGFDYRDCAVWDCAPDEVKQGIWFYQRAKFLLVGTRGNYKRPEMASKFYSPPRDNNLYSTLEALYPSASKVELFTEKPREGWTIWGEGIKC